MMIAIYTQNGEIINLNKIERIKIREDKIVAETSCYGDMGNFETYVLYCSDDKTALNDVMRKIKYTLSKTNDIISLEED